MEFTWQHHGTPISMKTFLVQHGISMRLIKSIKHGTGAFIVNQKTYTGAITIPDGAIAGIQLPDEASDPTIATSTHPLEILYEDANWLVVNKPAGLTSVPGPSDRADTLVNRIKGHLVATKAPNQKPHLITRLDRDTSGLVLVAKHRVAQGMMAYPPVAATLIKDYTAWVQGILTPEKGLIDAPLGPVPDSPRRAVIPTGQPAQTKYWVTGTGTDATRVKLELITGRTHQIRAHLTHLGHPLLGDALYGGAQTKITRQALHATTLTFQDPFSDERRFFTAPLPEDLQKLEQQLNCH